MQDADHLPPWISHVVAIVFGAGGLQFLRAWLESRRIENKDVRTVLLDRIRALEESVVRLAEDRARLMENLRQMILDHQDCQRKLDGQHSDTPCPVRTEPGQPG
jgi:hypothetical protein